MRKLHVCKILCEHTKVGWLIVPEIGCCWCQGACFLIVQRTQLSHWLTEITCNETFNATNGQSHANSLYWNKRLFAVEFNAEMNQSAQWPSGAGEALPIEFSQFKTLRLRNAPTHLRGRSGPKSFVCPCVISQGWNGFLFSRSRSFQKPLLLLPELLWAPPPPYCGECARCWIIPFRVSVRNYKKKRRTAGFSRSQAASKQVSCFIFIFFKKLAFRISEVNEVCEMPKGVQSPAGELCEQQLTGESAQANVASVLLCSSF